MKNLETIYTDILKDFNSNIPSISSWTDNLGNTYPYISSYPGGSMNTGRQLSSFTPTQTITFNGVPMTFIGRISGDTNGYWCVYIVGIVIPKDVPTDIISTLELISEKYSFISKGKNLRKTIISNN